MDNNVITVNNNTYNLEDMSANQRLILSHIQDIDTKLAAVRFNLDQLNVAREAFAKMLVDSLKLPENKE